MFILLQYQRFLKVLSSKFFLFSGEHGGGAVGRVEHEPGVQEPRSSAVDRRPAAAAAPPAGSQPFPGCLQDDHLFFNLSYPSPSQLNSPQFQQLLRAGLIGGQAGVANLQSAVNMAALMRPQAAQQSR